MAVDECQSLKEKYVATGAFSVNDEAVEVEDHGANGWGHADGWPRVAKDAKDSKAVKTRGALFMLFRFFRPTGHGSVLPRCSACNHQHPNDCEDGWSHGEARL